MTNGDPSTLEFDEGSGNAVADLELQNADELFARAKIGFHATGVLEGKKLKQGETAALLGVEQSEASHPMNGHFSRFTTGKLLDFLKRLDRKVTIRISPRKAGEPFQEIGVAP